MQMTPILDIYIPLIVSDLFFFFPFQCSPLYRERGAGRLYSDQTAFKGKNRCPLYRVLAEHPIAQPKLTLFWTSNLSTWVSLVSDEKTKQKKEGGKNKNKKVRGNKMRGRGNNKKVRGSIGKKVRGEEKLREGY